MMEIEGLEIETARQTAASEEGMAIAIAQNAQQIVINNDDEYQAVGNVLLEVSAKIKLVDKKRKELTQPLNKVIRDINAFFKPSLDSYKNAEANLKRAMSVFNMRAAAERQKALAETAEPVRTRDQQGFTALMQTANAHAEPEAAGTHTRDVWKFEVEDLSKVPREFLVLDEKKVRAHVQALKENARIPGVKIWKDVTIVARGKK
jgi:uncharacterized UPF0146 family protein